MLVLISLVGGGFEQVAIMKRVAWTLGVGFAGFFIGGKAGGAGESMVGLAWGASIGYGFGSIFSQTHATKKLVAYWAVTLGLVGPFFSLIFGVPPYPSLLELAVFGASRFHLAVVGAIGAGIAMLLGLLIGLMDFIRLRRASRVRPGEQAP